MARPSLLAGGRLSEAATCNKQGRLADARLAGRRGRPTRARIPAAEDAVELADAGRQSRAVGRVDLVDRDRLGPAGQVGRARPPGPIRFRTASWASGAPVLYSSRLSQVLQSGHLPIPLGVDAAAAVAQELGLGLGHGTSAIPDGGRMLGV